MRKSSQWPTDLAVVTSVSAGRQRPAVGEDAADPLILFRMERTRSGPMVISMDRSSS